VGVWQIPEQKVPPFAAVWSERRWTLVMLLAGNRAACNSNNRLNNPRQENFTHSAVSFRNETVSQDGVLAMARLARRT